MLFGFAVPGLHKTHSDATAADHDPAKQLGHVAAITPEYVPAKQDVHAKLFYPLEPELAVPAVQFVQIVAANNE